MSLPTPNASPAANSSLAVHVRGVSKTFGTGEAAVAALKGVDFDARQGELLMIVGPSGCGKTTLLSVIAGTLNFEGGELDVFGAKLHQMKPRAITEFRKRNVGFIFQAFNLIPTLSCIENVCVPLLINGVSRRVAERKAAALLEQVGLGTRGNERPLNLSGGQQQRVAIARALAMRPKVMLFDEPTSALDPERVGEVLKVIRDLASEGRTMILVTHEMAFARDVSNKVLFLHQGRVEESGSPAEIFGAPQSERCRQFVNAHRQHH